HTAIVKLIVRTICVENTGDAHINTMLAMKFHRDRLAQALGLVVACAHASRIDVTPVVLALWMFEWIAVCLRGRRHQEPRFVGMRQVKHTPGALGIDTYRLEGIGPVSNWAGRTGEVKYRVNRDVYSQIWRLRDISHQEVKPGMTLQRADIALGAC